MIKRFNKVEGRAVETIYGQERYGYSHSDFEDLYDLIEWAKMGGYQGSELLIYDFQTGEVYKPFDKKRNTVCSDPVSADRSIYFLQGSYDEKKVRLYKYLPGGMPEKAAELSMDEVSLYNLTVIGNPVYVISQNEDDELFRCYYPDQFSFPLRAHETVMLIDDGKIYSEQWIEEGWDDERNCATDEYRYYDKILVRDFAGNILSEEVGSLNKTESGDWWIS